MSYDDLENANLMSVIDRRRGLPVALGILFLHAARAQGWQADGLNFPGHFLIRLESGGERAILDPFYGGRRRSVVELRELLKTAAGIETELEPHHYAPVGNRDVLLRLQNNVKLRLLRGEQLGPAIETLEAMLLLAPLAVSLWHEAGLLQANAGSLSAAIRSFEAVIRLAPGDAMSGQAALFLQQLRQRLH